MHGRSIYRPGFDRLGMVGHLVEHFHNVHLLALITNSPICSCDLLYWQNSNLNSHMLMLIVGV